MKKNKFELIVVFVNQGYDDVVMDAAREAGVHGGTIVHARGTGSKEMEEKYGIAITPNKEMILILVDVKIRDAVLAAIYKAAGLGTKGAGIAFTLPVEETVGLKFDSDEEEKKEEPAPEETK